MKLKSIAWLVGGVAASILSFSPIAMANSNAASSPFSISPDIELTSEQEDELEDLRDRTMSQLSTVLSSSQQSQLEDSLASGEDFKTAVRSLDLSFKQRRQLKGIFGDLRSQIETILTPEQQQQIGQDIQSQR